MALRLLEVNAIFLLMPKPMLVHVASEVGFRVSVNVGHDSGKALTGKSLALSSSERQRTGSR